MALFILTYTCKAAHSTHSHNCHMYNLPEPSQCTHIDRASTAAPVLAYLCDAELFVEQLLARPRTRLDGLGRAHPKGFDQGAGCQALGARLQPFLRMSIRSWLRRILPYTHTAQTAAAKGVGHSAGSVWL